MQDDFAQPIAILLKRIANGRMVLEESRNCQAVRINTEENDLWSLDGILCQVEKSLSNVE